MHRPILTCAFLVLACGAMAQSQSQADPYQGQSNPPADDVITATQPDQPKPKPPAGKPMVQPQAQPMPSQASPQDSQQVVPQSAGQDNAAAPEAGVPTSDATGTDDGTVRVTPQPDESMAPALVARGAAADPDCDIVRLHPDQPNVLSSGTAIRVRLLDRLSSTESKPGEAFRTTVASDVLQDGQVLIPSGAEIDGHVVQVDPGTMRSGGAILLRPETVILADGSRFRLDAQVTGTPGSKTRVASEGFIEPPSRVKKNAMLYGAAVGGGVVVGAIVGGPVGAVTGGAIGAGAITTHILVDHTNTHLEPGTILLLTTSNRLDLQAANPAGN